MSHYVTLNKANWDERAALHTASKEYAVRSFISDPLYISDVVRFDRPFLGDISGLRGIHLQCHIGTDTISLARLGAVMTGLDFSPASVAEARLISERSGTPVNFVESDVYNAAKVLQPSSFDFVYTGIGALCWLPNITRWGSIVATLLRPGGRLIMREGHPILWAVNEAHQSALVVEYPYFEQEKPTVWNDATTYVTTEEKINATETHEWNHGMGEIITALVTHGMNITVFTEHDSVPWEALPGQMVKSPGGEWHLAQGRCRLPLSYTLHAVKK